MKSLRPADFVIVFLAAGITILCAAGIYGKSGSSPYFVIEGVSGSWVYPLNQTVRIDVPGPLGSTTVVIKDEEARVIASPCVNQSCVGHGSIRRKGEWIACLPNAVMVRVEDSGSPASTGKKETGHTGIDGAAW